MTGADSSLGPVVTEAVRTQLGQSRRRHVVQPTSVAAALRAHAAAADDAASTSRSRARSRSAKASRPSSTADVTGSAAASSSRCGSSRRRLATSWRRSTRRRTTAGDLLPALDKLDESLRGKIGESLSTVQTAPPLEQVTTASLEALKKYVQGQRTIDWATS